MGLKQFVCDEIVELSYGKGLIRMDIGTAGTVGKDGEEPKVDTVARLHFTPESFIRFAGASQGMVERLVEAGVFVRNEAAEDDAPPSLSS